MDDQNYAYDDEEIEEHDEDVDDDEEMSESDDDTSDAESEHDESAWSRIKEEAKARHLQDYEKLVQGFLDDGMNGEEAKHKAFKQILPVLQKEARNIYLESLQWMRELRRDPIHKQVMKTKHSYEEDDGFSGDEALEAAVHKRKFLLNKMFDQDDRYDDSDTEQD